MPSISKLLFLAIVAIEAFSTHGQDGFGQFDECSSSDSKTPSKVLLQKTRMRETSIVKRPHSKAGKLKAQSVSLNEDGYRSIAKLKDNREMAEFISRVVEDLGYDISDPGGLNGVAPYYSGKKAIQSFKALKTEISKVAKDKKGWLTKAGLGKKESEDDEEEDTDEDNRDDFETGGFNEADEFNNDVIEDEDELDEAMEMHHRATHDFDDRYDEDSSPHHHGYRHRSHRSLAGVTNSNKTKAETKPEKIK